MLDIYLYGDTPVLKNKLGIKNETALDRIESEMSSANMMLLYERGYNDFTPNGLCDIHRFLFEDVYEWAGQYRVINIEKRERVLGGRSVWYSNVDQIPGDLEAAFRTLHTIRWSSLGREAFVKSLAQCFSRIWQVHPFREGNTRTVAMLMTFFVEHYGYYMDHELLAECAGYVRDAFVMASIGQYAEPEHLQRILMDAVCSEPIHFDESDLEEIEIKPRSEKYRKYQTEKYTPEPHYAKE